MDNKGQRRHGEIHCIFGSKQTWGPHGLGKLARTCFGEVWYFCAEFVESRNTCRSLQISWGAEGAGGSELRACL